MYTTKSKLHQYGTIATLVFVILFFACATSVHAQGYQPLTGIPGVDPNNLSLVGYVNALFLLSIALGAMLAVIKIVLAGFKYMFTDAVPVKTDAKSDIYGALLGLGILLATFVVLYTINPQLTNLSILTGADRVQLINVPDRQPTQTPGVGGTTPTNTACPQGQQYVHRANGGGSCRDTTTNTTGEGTAANLCPDGQVDSQIFASADANPEQYGYLPYPDGSGTYYECVPAS